MVALAEAGADVNQYRESDGNTPLHVASQGGNAEVVSALMACNASLTEKNNKGQLPVDVAANKHIRRLINDEMTARFDHGFKRTAIPPPAPAPAPAVDSDTTPVLTTVDVSGFPLGSTMVNSVAQSVSSNLMSLETSTDIDLQKATASEPELSLEEATSAFFKAVESGNLEAAKAVAGRININVKGNDGTTALYKAALGGYSTMVEWLLTLGADTNIGEVFASCLGCLHLMNIFLGMIPPPLP